MRKSPANKPTRSPEQRDDLDVELIRRACGGDPVAQNVLLAKNMSVIEQFARSHSRKRAASYDADDIVQEALRGMVKSLAEAPPTLQSDPTKEFRSWMYTIVRRTSIDLSRADRSRKKRASDLSPDLAAAVPSPSHRLKASESRRRKQARIGALGSDQRTAVKLRGTGTSIAAIAAAMGRSTAAVKQLLSRARQSLQSNDHPTKSSKGEA